MENEDHCHGCSMKVKKRVFKQRRSRLVRDDRLFKLIGQDGGRVDLLQLVRNGDAHDGLGVGNGGESREGDCKNETLGIYASENDSKLMQMANSRLHG